MAITIAIIDRVFDPEKTHLEFRRALSNSGAVVAFTGLVRSDGDVSALSLSHYPGFTEKEVGRIAQEAVTRWKLDGVHIIHRVGEMAPGEPIVFVATASAHRRQSFEAADFIMDYLKSDAPFWKKEYRGESAEWIEPRDQDYTDKDRWRA